MKKIIFLLFLCPFAKAQTVSIPDANFKNFLIASVWNSNGDGEIQISEALAVTNLSFNSATAPGIADLTGIQSFANIESLQCTGYSNLMQLDVSGMQHLTFLKCDGNHLASLNTDGTMLQTLYCGNNQLATFDATALTNLQKFDISNNNLTSVAVAGLTSLLEFGCAENELTSLNLAGLSSLTFITFRENLITSVDVSDLTSIKNLQCQENQLAAINLAGLSLLEQLWCSDNFLTSLDLSQNPKLFSIQCDGNNLQSLDISANPDVAMLNLLENAPLEYLNIKNGRSVVGNSWLWLDQYENPNLAYICADDGEILFIQSYLMSENMSNVQINSYCSFAPGGVYNTISGNIRFDAGDDGCDVTDLPQSFVKLMISDGGSDSFTVCNTSGNFDFFTGAGNFALEPIFENPSYFTATPQNATVAFADSNSNISTQNFCIIANGIHNDVEIIIVPNGQAGPGFDSTYTILFKNKGNQTISGDVNFAYDDAVLDFANA